MTTQMIVRLDPDLKAKVHNFAKIEGKSVSEVFSSTFEKYLQQTESFH